MLISNQGLNWRLQQREIASLVAYLNSDRQVLESR